MGAESAEPSLVLSAVVRFKAHLLKSSSPIRVGSSFRLLERKKKTNLCF